MRYEAFRPATESSSLNMAKTSISDEELQLRKRARRRLVGAIGLVLLVVVFVPMFLDRGPRQQKQDMDICIPPVPGQTQTPVPSAPPMPASAQSAAPTGDAAGTTTATPTPPASVTTQAGTQEHAAPPQPVPMSAPSAAAPEGEKAARAPDKPADTPTAEATAPSPEEFVIQLGAFADRARAKEILAKVKAEKVAAYLEAVKLPQGVRIRVRAGPFPTLQAAEKAKEQLKAAKLLPSNNVKIVRRGE